jgi:hypothetical protein
MCVFLLVFGLRSGEKQKAGKQREVQAVSLPIKQDSSAKDFTGRVKVRTSGENAFAGLYGANGKRIGRNPVCVGRLFCGGVDQLHGKNREDDDKRTRPNEKRVACAIESTSADGVVHLEKVRPEIKAERRS